MPVFATRDLQLIGLAPLADNTFVGMLIVSWDFTQVVWRNNAACLMFGVSCSEGDDQKTQVDSEQETELIKFLKKIHSPLIKQNGFTPVTVAEYARSDGKVVFIKNQMFMVQGVESGSQYFFVHTVDVSSEKLLFEHLTKIKETQALIDGQYVTDQEIQKALILRYHLTLTEVKVAFWIWKGESSKCIAARMNISPATANVHRRNIRKKMALLPNRSLFDFLTFLAAELET